jgi:hypothetical protein
MTTSDMIDRYAAQLSRCNVGAIGRQNVEDLAALAHRSVLAEAVLERVRGAVAELRRQSETAYGYSGIESGTLTRAANLIERAILDVTSEAEEGAAR